MSTTHFPWSAKLITQSFAIEADNNWGVIIISNVPVLDPSTSYCSELKYDISVLKQRKDRRLDKCL